MQGGFDCICWWSPKIKNNLCCLHPWCTGGKATMCPDYKGLAANELIVLYRSLYGIDQYVTSKYYIPSKRFNQPASALMSHNSVPTRLSCGCWSLSKQSSQLPWVTLNWLPVYHRTRVHVSGLWEDVRCGLGNMPTVHRKTWIGIKHATFLLFGFNLSGFLPVLTHLCLHLFPPSSLLCKSCLSHKPNKATEIRFL